MERILLKFLSKRASLMTVSLSALFLVLGTTQLTAGDDEKVSIVIKPIVPKKIPANADAAERDRHAKMEAQRAARRADPLILKYAAQPFSLYRVTGDGACFYTAVQEKRRSLVRRIIDEVTYNSSGKRISILQVLDKMSVYNSFQKKQPSLDEATCPIRFMGQYIPDQVYGEAEFAVMKAILDGNKNIFVWGFHDKELPVKLVAHHQISEDADNFHIYHTPGHFSFLASPVDKDYPRQRALGQLIEEAYLKPEKIISKEKIDERMAAHLNEFVRKSGVSVTYTAIRKSGNNAPDEELVAYILGKQWGQLTPEEQKQVVSMVTKNL